MRNASHRRKCILIYLFNNSGIVHRSHCIDTYASYHNKKTIKIDTV